MKTKKGLSRYGRAQDAVDSAMARFTGEK